MAGQHIEQGLASLPGNARLAHGELHGGGCRQRWDRRARRCLPVELPERQNISWPRAAAEPRHRRQQAYAVVYERRAWKALQAPQRVLCLRAVVDSPRCSLAEAGGTERPALGETSLWDEPEVLPNKTL